MAKAEENVDQSFLDLALDEVPELKAVPNGEYQLKVTSVKMKESKGEKTAGQSLLMFYFDIMGEENTRPISYPVMLPHDTLDNDANNDRKRQLKRVLKALDWDVSQGFEPNQLKDLTCFAHLSTETTPEYGEQNKIANFVTPK